MMPKHELVAADILPVAEYAKQRTEHRRRVAALKRDRRIEVGPYVTFYFESYDTMWLQVQEMVYIEKGGAAQVPDELAAYDPLVPKGNELVATFMIEIDEPDRRQRILGTLGGIEETAFLRVAGETIKALAEADQDRTTAEGKASSVQFVHFPFTKAQVAAFCRQGAEVMIGFTHPKYGHMAVVPEHVRAELARDFG
ncbi:MAG TPA: DUF3501 family protein [Acetobacteraceae bacterium]|jgi:hypothetical protein|nr:DUF3501 family protein [Acetobacteraceae bacterium]